MVVFSFAVSPRTWPEGAWVPGGPRPSFAVCFYHDSIKADIGDLVYNGPRGKATDDSAVLTPPPGRFVFDARGRASNDPPPGL